MTDDYIEHYGVPRRSGRYPWGSGDIPYQGGDENSINGIARNLQKRDLIRVSESLGLSSKPMSYVKSNPDYSNARSLLFGIDENDETGSTARSPSDDENDETGSTARSPSDDENDETGSTARSPSDDENDETGSTARSPSDDENDETGSTASKKKSWFDSLISALENMVEFFERKISDIVDKFND